MLRKESDLSWASPQRVMLFSSFHANFYPHSPSPSCYSLAPQLRSLFLFLSFFPPSTSPHISIFCFYFPPAVFLDRSLTHAFPFRISIGLFCPLSLCALVPFSFCASCPRVKQPPPRWVRMTVPLAFPVPALPTSVQLLSQGRGGFGMVGWQRQGDWCKNEVQKKGERELGGGRETV